MSEVPPGIHVEASENPITVSKEVRDYGHGEITLIHSVPETTKTASGTENPVPPLLFVQGWGQDGTLEDYTKLFAETGRETVGILYSGKRDNKDYTIHPEELTIPLSTFQLGKAQDILSGMKEVGIEQADVVATSEGAIRAMYAIALEPERFRNVLLVHPVGIDDRSGKETAARIARQGGRTLLKMIRARAAGERSIPSGYYGLRQSDKRRLATEAKNVVQARLHDLLPALTTLYPHLRFVLAGDKSDGIYPPHRLREVNGSHVTEIYETDWGDHGIGLHPDRIQEIDHILTRMGNVQAP
jgi:pimeloyl-ACP methyl ester carboxylesterase